ncbi:MAG: hypothetical protein ACYS0G_13625 [Planctomycetota bacterium]|jgi:hypothetical protein
MKRLLITILIFLLAGALVNVAVAWGSAIWVNPTKAGRPDPEVGFRSSGQYTWEFVRTVLPGQTLLWSSRGWKKEHLDTYDHGPPPEEFVPWWTDLGAATSDFTDIVNRSPDSLVMERRWLHCFGWPARSLWSHWNLIDPGDSPPLHGSEGYVLSLDPWMNFVPRVLPARPIWHGFAVNTLFYAAVLWLLICGPFALRRLIRMKRGRCVKCGYPLGESPVCTECGKALSQRGGPAT